MTRVQFLAGAIMGFISLCHHVFTSSGDHPASCQMDTDGSFPRGKVVRA